MAGLSEKQKSILTEDAKYPMRFAAPCFFGNPSYAHTDISNGTVTLIRFKDEKFGLTAAHVIDEYIERKSNDGNLQLHIGGHQVSLDDILFDKDQSKDICVLYLDEYEEAGFSMNGGVPTEFIDVKNTEIDPPEAGEFLLFGGYPGDLRRIVSHNELNFGTMSSGGTQIEDVSIDQLLCQLRITEATFAYSERKIPAAPFGGLSGGPVFVRRTSNTGIVTFPLIGTIFEYGETMDILRVRLVSCLDDCLYIRAD